jgi:hypothetical protein
MRPVTIVDPPNYPYLTAVDEQGASKTFATNSSTAVVYNPMVGATTGPAKTFNFREITLELLDKTVKPYGPFPNPSTADDRRRTKNAMRETLTNGTGPYVGYLAARPNMTKMIGEYCSFCELPLKGFLLAIEHRAPKELYPTYMIRWSNFLLACRDCNSIKGKKPSRATAKGWSGKASPTETELVAAILARYYWPDQDDVTYQAFPPTYYRHSVTGGAMKQITSIDASDRQNRMVGDTETQIRADVVESGTLLKNRKVEVRIANAATAVTIGDRTLDLTGLDRIETARSAVRTKVWLSLCKTLKRLFDGVAAKPNKAEGRGVFDDQWPLILELAVERGFYSVWVEILTGYGFPKNMTTAGLKANLGAQFVYDTNPLHNADTDQTFPGTNYTDVP